MSEAWIIVCLFVIAGLYALLFATADSLDADERRKSPDGAGVDHQRVAAGQDRLKTR